jgi:hypothetical protein
MPRRLRLLALLLLAACRAAPTVDGKPVGPCTADSECPTNLRCIHDTCLNNSLPVFEPFDLVRVVLGADIVATAVAEDADGDDLTLTWRQIDNGAPSVLPQPLTGAELRVRVDRAEQIDDYVFEVTADDGYGEGTARINVIVYNTLPVARTQNGRLGVEPGDAVLLDATATDTDGHTVTVTWMQASGPPLGLDGTTGSTLGFTPNTVGQIVARRRSSLCSWRRRARST